MLASAATAQELGSAQLQIAGTRLTVSPESQTVPFDVPTVIETTLEGFDPSLGPLPSSLRVLGELSGPEIDGVLLLEAVPGQPLRIPRLRLEGEYMVENIRLVDGDTLLTYASPRSAVVQVTEVLVTRVSSRPLTLDEIRSLGIVIGDDSFQMFRFVFGFGVDGEEIVVEFPASVDGVFVSPGRFLGGDSEWRPPSQRFRPPQLVPFSLGPPASGPGEITVPGGGCPPALLRNGCRSDFSAAPLVGVIAIPTDVALLHQFFSVVLMVQNGAPAGDPLVLRDLAARVTLSPSLRQAQTVPATPLGVPVPIRVPGPDGEVGTGDDLTFLVAQSEAEAEFLLEGLEEGSHIVRFDIDGVLDGLPSGPRAVSGGALGAVVVRDPHLQVTINHPEVVRADEQYAMHMTVANIGPAPVNLLGVTLPASGLSGVSVVGSSTQTIESLLPGEAETVSFDMLAGRTGRVIASTVRTGANVTPSFELSVGVSTDGIPLSPDAIVLPNRVTEVVPEAIARPALSLLGLGHSLATARPADLPPNLPPVGGDAVVRRVYRLAQAAHHIELGEDPFDSFAVLAAEWQGIRDDDQAWDALRRVSSKGRSLATGFGAVFAAEALLGSPRQMAERFYAATGFFPEHALVLADGGVELALASQTSGLRASGPDASGMATSTVRDLPFAELYPAGAGSTLGLLTRLESAGYRLTVKATASGPINLDLLLPDGAGGLRAVRWTGVSLAAGDVADVVFTAADASFALLVDRFADGLVDETIAAQLQSVAPRPFAVVAAQQNIGADSTGHVVDVLFTRDIDRAALADRQPSRFQLDDLVSDGGALTAGGLRIGAVSVAGSLRLIRVLFDNPIGSSAGDLLVSSIPSAGGEILSQQLVPLVITQTAAGGVVEGTVLGSDGQPVPFALVELFESDLAILQGGECVEHKTGAVRSDAAGRFHFGFVRAATCDAADRFRLAAFDPSDLAHGDAIGRVRFIGQITELNVVMIGRGRVEGQVLYEDGSVPSGLEVRVLNPVFQAGRLAHVGQDGRFDADDIMVGTVEISANDDAGGFAFATVELPTAGAISLRDLVIVRSAPAPTGQVGGTATNADGSQVLAGAILALYVDQVFIGTTISDATGRFDFGTALAGTAEIEIFDPQTTASGGRVFFEIATDQVVDIAVPLRDARATVEGHVRRQLVDGTVVPVRGAIVWAFGQQANTVSGDDGSYRLEGVLAGNDIKIHAADPQSRERIQSAAGTVLPGGTLVRDLLFIEQLDVSGAIVGELLDWNGMPVAGAFIHVANRPVNPTLWTYEAVTGSDGQFVLRGTAFTPNGTPVDIGFEPGTYALHAIAGALGATASAEIRFPGDTPFVTLRLKRGTVRVRTAVRQPDGTEIGIVSQVQWRPTKVEFGLLREVTFPITLETDPSGDLLLSDVLIGTYELFVSNAFHGERLIRGSLTDHGQENFHDIVFAETTGAVRGRVLDYDGVTPLAGIKVAIHAGSLGEFDVTTDAAGRYAFELVPIRGFSIDATLDGPVFRTSRLNGHLSRSGQVLEDVDIVLPRQGSVIGLVEDADGVRVAGAVLTLNEHSYPHRRLLSTADQDGNFSFENVIAGGFAVSAQAPSLGGLGGRTGGRIDDEGQVVETVITLEATGEVIGQVLSPVDGIPVSSARVRLVTSGGGLVEAIDSDDSGAFRFRLLPLATYKLRAFDPASGRFGESPIVTLAANGEVAMRDVTLQVRGEVDGRVLAPEGMVPIPGATVKLRSQTPQFHLETFSSTDTAGAFLFGGIPEGAFALSVREPGGRRKAVGSGTIGMEDERVTVDLVLEAFGSVRGSVLQPPGAPAGLFPNANVRILGVGNLLLGASLENPFVLDGLLPNERFTLRAEELAGPHRGVASGRLPADGGEIVVDVAMVAFGQVVVSVVDSFGNPVPGAEVSMTGRSVLGWDTRNASTGGDHRVTFAEVAAGTISLFAHDVFRGLKGSASAVLALDGESLAVTVGLEDTGFVQGTVLLPDGLTPTSEVVIALEQSGEFRFAQAAADGSFFFEAVRVGAWTLSVQHEIGAGRFGAIGSIAANGEIDDLGSIVLDEADPQVVGVMPESGSRDLPVNASLTVTFSEPMDITRWASNSALLQRFDGALHGYTTAWNAEQTVVTLTPTSALRSATLYELFITTRIVDLAGRSIPETVRSTFTTADVVPPAVIDIVPRDAENQIAIASPILITFSEPVELTSLSGPALELYDLTTGAGVTTTFQLRPNGREVILTAAFGLVADRQYRVTVREVSDPSANVMPVPLVTTFWTVDETLPVGSFETPAAGAIYTAGELIHAAATATDNRGVGAVSFRIGSSISGVGIFPAVDVGGDRYEASLPAPRVAVASDLVLEAEIVDIFGNVTVLSRTVRVEPRVNASGPAISAPCLYAGDQVRPARDLVIPLTVSDDEGIESYRLLVDGVEQTAVAFQHLAEIGDTFTWTVPATALPGASFAVRLEVTDYAGNLGVYEAAVKTPADLVLAGDRVLDAATVDGRDVAIADGTFTVLGPLAPTSLAVLPGATVISQDGGRVDIVATGDLRVQCGGTIDVVGLGYAGATQGSPNGEAPAGIGPSGPDAGGSHGGLGIPNDGAGPAGETFGSVYAPAHGGGGGALASATETGSARAGGGIVHLVAAEVVLGGDVLARGDGLGGPGGNGQGGGGAGGSVWIEGGVLRGAGTVDASGADYSWCPVGPHRREGAGGGGRIALDVGSLDGFDPALQARAQGGQLTTCFDDLFGIAGAGTVYVRTAGATYGELHVDGGAPRGAARAGAGSVADGHDPAPTPLPALGTGTVVTATVEGFDLRVTPASGLLRRWLGAWMRLDDSTGTVLGSFRVLEVDGLGNALLEGAAGATAASSYRGEYRFDRIETRNRAQVILGSPWVLGDHVAADDATLGGLVEAASLRLSSATSWRTANEMALQLDVAGTLTLDAGAALDADGTGYQGPPVSALGGAAPAGIPGATGRGGGSHGGRGRIGTNGGTTNIVYGSPYWPRFGGASAEHATGDGGGMLAIRAGSVVLNGTIRARGQGDVTTGGAGAAGAGGSVLIETPTLSGSGELDVSGGTWARIGSGAVGHNGGGGGGRAALYVGSFVSFDVAMQVKAEGGTHTNDAGTTGGYAAPGSVFIFDSASVFGTLRVAQQLRDAQALPESALPTLGSGTVAAVTADAAVAGAAWIEAAAGATFGLGSEGAWLSIGGVDYRILAESADGTAVLLDGAAGTVGPAAVTVGAAYVGVWKFDRVVVDGGATLVFADRPEVTTFEIIDGTVVQPVGSWISPAEGEVFEAGANIHAEVDTGSNPIDRVIYHFDGGTFTDTSAPFVADIPAPFVGASTAFTLRAEIIDSFANTVDLERQLSVTPHANALAPVVEVPCHLSGDRVRPGTALAIAMTAVDDEAIERYSFVVNSVLIEASRFGATSTVDASYSWTPPIDAMPNQAFVLRFEAVDYAGNVGAEEITLYAPSDLLLTAGGSLDAATVNGRDVVLGAGTFTAIEPLAPSSLAILPGVIVIGEVGETLEIMVTGDLRVQCGGKIDVVGLGYAGATPGSPSGGAPAGIGPSGPDAGGSHGGLGITFNGAGPVGETFGSVYAPTLGGGGGAIASVTDTGAGAAGGGALHLIAGELALGGEVMARGQKRQFSSHRATGAGGSVRVEAGILRGGGLIDASGADGGVGCNNPDGAGGGGRIALDVGTLEGFDPVAQAVAHGGQLIGCFNRLWGIAGAGTVYLRTAAATYGDLHVDGGEPRTNRHVSVPDPYDPELTLLPALGTGPVASAVAEGLDLRVTGGSAFLARWLGAWMRLDDGAGAVLGTYRVLEIDGLGAALLEGAAGAASAASRYRGEYRFDRVLTRNRARLVFGSPWVTADHLAEDNATIGGVIEAASLRVAAGTSLYAATGEALLLRIAGTLTLEAGASIDATGRGFAPAATATATGDAPPGVLGAFDQAGGSHGGLGRVNDTNDVLGETYGSVFAPRHGGGGGGRAAGSHGGGVIDIVAGTVDLEGRLLARGQDRPDGFAFGGGAGAGGTIRVDAGLLRGGGSIEADGGSWFNRADGIAGGGGRVALYVGTFVGFVPQAQATAAGGAQNPSTGVLEYAGPGTVFVHETASTHGRLYVIQSGTSAAALPATSLPVLGRGTVGTVTPDTVDPGDLWIDDAGGRLFDLGVEGMWVRVLGTDFRVIAQTGDRSQLLLGAAAGLVAVGDTYAGLYKLDEVVVDGGTLVFGDADEVGSYQILGGGQVVAPFEVDAPVISNALPADQTVFLRNQTIDFSADIADASAVDQVTLTIDGVVQIDTEAPWAFQWTAPMVSSATAYDFTLAARDTQGNEATLTRTLQVELGLPPTIVSVTPAEATSFSSGELVVISANVTDDAAVASVTFTLDGISFVDGMAPYAWSVAAPSVVAGTDFVIAVDAMDAQGHHALLNRTIHVEPGITVAPPTLLGAGCVRDGTLALAGMILPIDFTLRAPDGDTVTSWSVIADGIEVAGASGLSVAEVTASTSWTLPAGAVAGENFVVRIQGHTAAGGFVGDDRTISVPLSYLAGPIDLDATHDGQSLILGPGVFTATEAFSPASLILMNGASLTHPQGSMLEIASAGELRLACGSAIDVVGRGFVGGAKNSAGRPGESPSWVSAAGVNAGGGHGGEGMWGGLSFFPGGEIYDSVYRPTLAGGGGGSSGSADGRAGGGVISITAASLVVEGAISARGADAFVFYEGAGGGGAVAIRAGSLQGSGTIDVRGGDFLNATSTCSGGGGGGRVSLVVDTVSGFDPSTQILVRGGRRSRSSVVEEASPGTAYVLETTDTWGRLYVAAEADSAPVGLTGLPALGAGSVTLAEVEGSDLWITSGSVFRPRWDGAWIKLFDASGALLGTFNVLATDAAGRALIADAAARSVSVATYEGIYRFDSFETLHGAALGASDLVELGDAVLAAGDYLVPPRIRAASLSLESGARLLPQSSVSLDVVGTLTIATGASIDVTGMGYVGGPKHSAGRPGESPSWAVPAGFGAGGSHGGEGMWGANAHNLGGEIFGSLYLPRLGGGGGGSSGGSDGGDGGGVITIEASALAVEGSILARGADAGTFYEGAGAGGTVVIRASTLGGSGTIDVRGGDYVTASTWGGGGGGGRVSLLVDDLSGFDPATQVLARGGRRVRSGITEEAVPGTAYVLETTDTWGRLFLAAEADSSTVAATAFPALGTGTVALAEVDGSDLWITGSATFHPRWDGAWIELLDGLGASLGRFSVLETDAMGRARVADAAVHAAAAASYAGVYRFDSITTAHGATFATTDTLETATP